MQRDSKPYTYLEAGFNGFLRRSINTRATAGTLRDMSRTSTPPTQLNFDNMQVSGSLGDTLEIGRILLNGADGQIDLRADATDDVVVRIGELNG